MIKIPLIVFFNEKTIFATALILNKTRYILSQNVLIIEAWQLQVYDIHYQQIQFHIKGIFINDIYRGYLNSTNNRMKLSQAEAENLSYFNKIKRPALDLISNQIHVELLEKPAREQLSISKSA